MEDGWLAALHESLAGLSLDQLISAGDQVVLSPASLCIVYKSMAIIIHAFPFYYSTFLAFFLLLS